MEGETMMGVTRTRARLTGVVALLVTGVFGIGSAGCKQTSAEPSAATSASAAPAEAPTTEEPAVKEAPKPALPAPVALNQPGTHGGTTITVSKVQDVAPTPKSEKPRDGQKLIAVSVEVKPSGAGSAMYAGALFDVVDGGGKRFRSSILPCSDKPLGSGSVASGSTAQGDLCFIVPKDASGLKLMFKSGGRDALPFAL